MPQLVAQQKLYLGAYNLTAQVSSIGETSEIAELPATTLGTPGFTEINEPGLKGWGLSADAFYEAGVGSLDDALSGRLRVSGVPLSIAAVNGTVGETARLVKTMIANYEWGASVGELNAVNVSAGAASLPLQGRLMHQGAATGNVTGTAVQVGALGSGQTLYAALHVFSGTGGFTVNIQSASTAGGSYTTRASFATVLTGTPRATEWLEYDTPQTDTFWRITATNPNTRDFAVTLAIF